MTATLKSLMAQTADDLMSRHVVRLRDTMPLREAAQLMIHNQIGGAPVVDAQGRCVGVLSALDYLRLLENRPEAIRAPAVRRPVSCPFQEKTIDSAGRPVMRCTLPPGVCPLQVQQTEADEEVLNLCTQPDCVLVDWQMVDLEQLPADEVRQFMTPDPVMTRPETSIRTLARMMVDAHIHRIVVVDEERRPVGLVSSTDLLAALAFAEDEE